MKDTVFQSFAWRFWNTFKSIILPVILPLFLLELQKTPNDLSSLATLEFWEVIGYGTLVAIAGSALAGLDKIKRIA